MGPTRIEPTTSSSRNDRANHQVTPRCCSFEAGAEATVEHNRGSNEARKYFWRSIFFSRIEKHKLMEICFMLEFLRGCFCLVFFEIFCSVT